MEQVIYLLTCVDTDEANKIAHALVDGRLAACVKTIPVSSTFRWDDKVQDTQEVLLMIESLDDHFGAVNKVIKNLHSYEQYVLNQINVSQSNDGVLAWVKGGIS